MIFKEMDTIFILVVIQQKQQKVQRSNDSFNTFMNMYYMLMSSCELQIKVSH